VSPSIERQATALNPQFSVGDVDRSITVLIADDNADVLLATSDLIQDYPGVEIISLTTNVEEAVRSVAWNKPAVAFIDAWLSGGGAEGVMARIKEISPSTTVIVLASAPEAELTTKVLAAGAVGCFEKETLSAVIPSILARLSDR
jgi:DNA-binding NarL/FixJ family response regulator